jgi:opacity protein-like surface antigen
MKLTLSIRVLTLVVCAVLCLAAPFALAAQKPEESAPRSLWSHLKEGKISADIRYRFEMFERDGEPFTAPAYAPTLKISLGYATPSFHGFSAFAQGVAILATGPADYSIPTSPSQNRPDRPAILDPKSLELGQGYLRWTGGPQNKRLELTVGRQEIMLNDGRFITISTWRQDHQTFDAAKLKAELPWHVSFSYAFLNRAYRVMGHDATDGKPPMHSHLLDLAWRKGDKVNVSLYGVLLGFRAPSDFNLATQTFGLRATGPFQFNQNWGAVYTAEFANQRNFGNNPNMVNANYYLGELGPAWRGFSVLGGYALLGGRSVTDKLSTPLAHPFNGWTDLFANNPSLGNSHGLEARYLTANGPLRLLGGVRSTLTYYDYHSDSHRIHYGNELDMALAFRVRRVSDRWEIGWRFGRYWADHLFTNAVRTSVYTSFSL